ncbi:hypothetical protein [Psychroserpens algicola]|uniref:Uncharacterized protein n=1 Tax=Psychroserpens algicola TaxID=1719034 RepID=A0ABT0HBK7_9FLAO|nr:hypothetical protein [Psychroserpens algicola]MCK8481434.1 hypothetical protein [Psychroserpens algicola]
MKIKLTLIAIGLCLFNCKQDGSQQDKVKLDYKHASRTQVIDCDGVDNTLIQEALFAFEDDILNFYTPDKPIYSRAYSLFVSQSLTGVADYPKMVSEHSKQVFEALKQDKSLWTTNPDGSRLNFNHPLFKCIGNEIADEPLSKTYNALIDTKSMSLRMFGDQLKRKTFGMKDDKYLATYVALELFYGKLYDVDFNKQSKDDNYEENSGLKEHSSHDGHNH